MVLSFVNDGAQIQSLAEGEGNSGKIFINASDTVAFDGRDDNDSASAALSNIEEDATGNADGIEIIAASLSLRIALNLQVIHKVLEMQETLVFKWKAK